MNFAYLTKNAGKLLADNSPTILSGIAVVGTAATAYLTGKASFKAADVIMANQIDAALTEKGMRDPQNLTKVKLVWKLYLPPAAACATTIACVVGANRISARRMAALAVAYSVAERSWDEYKDKIVEKMGPIKEQQARDELAQDQVSNNPPNREVIIVGNGDVMCYDSISGRYFKNTVEGLRSVQNDLNEQLLNNSMYMTLNEFFLAIGLTGTEYGEEVGWTPDNKLELDFSTILSPDGQPCVSIRYHDFPIRGVARFH